MFPLLVCRWITVSSLLVVSSVSRAASSSSVIHAMNSSLLSVVAFLFISAFVSVPSGSRMIFPSRSHIAIVRFQLRISSKARLLLLLLSFLLRCLWLFVLRVPCSLLVLLVIVLGCCRARYQSSALRRLVLCT